MDKPLDQDRVGWKRKGFGAVKLWCGAPCPQCGPSLTCAPMTPSAQLGPDLITHLWNSLLDSQSAARLSWLRSWENPDGWCAFPRLCVLIWGNHHFWKFFWGSYEWAQREGLEPSECGQHPFTPDSGFFQRLCLHRQENPPLEWGETSCEGEEFTRRPNAQGQLTVVLLHL